MKLIALNLVSTLILTLNILLIHSAILGVIFGLIFIILSSLSLGKILFKNNFSGEQWLFGFLTFLSITIIALTVVYYFYKLNDLIVASFIIFVSSVLLLLSQWKKSFVTDKSILKIFDLKITNHQSLITNYFLPALYLIFLSAAYFLLKSGATLEAVRTPWIFVPKTFFIAYFLATAVLIYLSTKLKSIYTLILTSLHLLFSFNLANIIFPLGFGYDPFIHEATEKHILDFGFILPKNFYYLGQYSLVIFLTKIFQISHVIIDKNLVPLLASILLPATIFSAFKKLNFPLYIIHNTLYIFLLIPFSIFTFTTPQNLADLLVIVIAFLGFKFLITNYQLPITNYGLLFLLSLAILFIHPLAGVAALIFCILLFLKNKIKKILYYFITLLLLFLFPLVFFTFSKISLLNQIEITNNFNLTNFYHNLFRFSPDLFLNTNFVHLCKTVAYFLWQPVMLFVVIIGLAVYGWRKFNVWHKMNNVLCIMYNGYLKNSSNIFLQIFIILLINSFFVFSFISFPFLIDYERGDFSWRIFNLGIYFLIPLAMFGAWKIIRHIIKCDWIPLPPFAKSGVGMTTLILIISAGATFSLYFSYPRQDVYMLNRGFNTSIHDFQAVKYLDEITKEPYVVLANQQIGAAALTEFGFRYFDHKYFFYSIPTGGKLYKIYAKMAYDELIDPQVAKEAMDLTGANIIYLYLPDYWFNLKKIKPRLEAVADETLNLENGKVWVFKFVRK